ncbi:uncharacterized protein LOC126554205 [Aphis gossypii]|uniref:uncharacterized protein LOC126554205 n=1 Tax=Aphis gossypii TaxID=80765 RepID=UPI002158D4B4|nr:uncharacterized protein LOC126554205 [Aphis gossypii]
MPTYIYDYGGGGGGSRGGGGGGRGGGGGGRGGGGGGRGGSGGGRGGGKAPNRNKCIVCFKRGIPPHSATCKARRRSGHGCCR